MELGSSAVECQTHNRESPGPNPPFATVKNLWAFVFSPRRSGPPSCRNEYLAMDSGGNVSDLVVARNCCMARMVPREVELVAEQTGLPGVKCKVL